MKTSIKWNELYTTEQELIDDMMKVETDWRAWDVCQGYGYLDGFKKYYSKYGYLTDKQMVQLKRLASTIYDWLYGETAERNKINRMKRGN